MARDARLPNPRDLERAMAELPELVREALALYRDPLSELGWSETVHGKLGGGRGGHRDPVSSLVASGPKQAERAAARRLARTLLASVDGLKGAIERAHELIDVTEGEGWPEEPYRGPKISQAEREESERMALKRRKAESL